MARCALVAVLLAGLLGCGDPDPPEVLHTTPLYSVVFPAKPEVTLEKLQVPDLGETEVHTATAEVEGGFLVSSSAGVGVPDGGFDQQASLEGALKASVDKRGAKLVTRVNMELGGLPAIEALFDEQGKFMRRTRLLIDPAGPTLISVHAIGSRAFVHSPAAQRFLDSLRLERR